jgi:DNA topoisomerase-1
LGEATKDEDGKPVKPKRASLPKGVAPDEIDLDRAVKLLALPRTVGKHPDDGEDIIAGVGRFGPYVKHGKIYANISADEDILNVGLNRAVALIEEKKANPGKGRRGADPGKQLGEHPQKGGMIVAKNGRYGPYVSHDGVNANLPGDKTPESITLDEAAALIDDRAARSGGGSTARRKRPVRGASATKKAPAPKARPAAQANKTAAPASKAPVAAKPKKRAAASAAKAPRKSKKAKAEAAE